MQFPAGCCCVPAPRNTQHPPMRSHTHPRASPSPLSHARAHTHTHTDTRSHRLAGGPRRACARVVEGLGALPPAHPRASSFARQGWQRGSWARPLLPPGRDPGLASCRAHQWSGLSATRTAPIRAAPPLCLRGHCSGEQMLQPGTKCSKAHFRLPCRSQTANCCWRWSVLSSALLSRM